MITVRVSIHSPSMLSRNGRVEKSVSSTAPCRYSAPKFCACFFMFSTRSGPWIPSGNPGKFSTSVVRESCPPASCPLTTSGLQIRPRGINRGRISGAAGPDDHDVSHDFVGRNSAYHSGFAAAAGPGAATYGVHVIVTMFCYALHVPHCGSVLQYSDVNQHRTAHSSWHKRYAYFSLGKPGPKQSRRSCGKAALSRPSNASLTRRNSRRRSPSNWDIAISDFAVGRFRRAWPRSASFRNAASICR